MKAINITPEVFKLLTEIVGKQAVGHNAAAYALDKALDKEKVQVFKEEGTNIFWLENHDAPKYAVEFIKTRLKNDKGYTYRDDWKETKNPVKKAVKVLKEAVAPKEEKQDLQLASLVDLKLFVKKYMKDYKMSAEFKAKTLDAETMSAFFKEVGSSYTDAISKMINKIYGGEKPNYRNKNKMSEEERKQFDLNNHEEFNWFFENLVWLAKPSKKYIKEHKKFSTGNYMKVAADLSSCVQNSLCKYRTSGMF